MTTSVIISLLSSSVAMLTLLSAVVNYVKARGESRDALNAAFYEVETENAQVALRSAQLKYVDFLRRTLDGYQVPLAIKEPLRQEIAHAEEEIGRGSFLAQDVLSDLRLRVLRVNQTGK